MTSVDFDLRQLEIFCKVVELGSFSKAAKEVFLAQASVSERIATLEKGVGTRLLDRLGRQVVPTKAGELLYKHATLLLDHKRTVCLEMTNFLGNRQGRIHIGGSTIPGEYILPGLIGRYREKYPLVTVLLTIGDTTEIKELVLQGDIELGIIGAKSPHKNLVHHELWQDELVLAVPAGHRWAKKKKVSLKELLDETFILREKGSGTLKILDNFLTDSGSKCESDLKTAARLGSSTAVMEGVKAGLGVSILSSTALKTELKTGSIKALRIKDLPMFRNFYLIRDKRRISSPLCRSILDFLLATTSNKLSG